MRPANSLFELIGRGGTLRLHVHSAKLPIHYLVDSQTLISLTKMRNVILNRNQTTWANAGTRIKPQTFYEPDLIPEIGIRDLCVCGVRGGGPFNDFADRIGNMEDLKTRERNERRNCGVEIINPRTAHGRQFAR